MNLIKAVIPAIRSMRLAVSHEEVYISAVEDEKRDDALTKLPRRE